MIGKCIYKTFCLKSMNYKLYSFVLAAPNRRKVVMALDTEKTPKQLVKELGKQDANISRTLRELTNERIIKCLTPHNKRGRIYILTKDGIDIRKKLQ